MQNLRMFEITYLGATNSLGSRVKIMDLRFNKRVILSIDRTYNQCHEQALDFLKELGIECEFRSYDDAIKVDYLLTTNFETQLTRLNGE